VYCVREKRWIALILWKFLGYLEQGCSNPGRQFTQATKFCTVSFNIFRSLIRYSCHSSGVKNCKIGSYISGRFLHLLHKPGALCGLIPTAKFKISFKETNRLQVTYDVKHSMTNLT
jgi:hypothetical protein